MINNHKEFFSYNNFVYMFIVYLFMVTSCYYEAGTLGGGDTYKFDCTRGELQNCLNSFSEKYVENKVPKKWHVYNDWHERGYDFLNGTVFYFQSGNGGKEEMYYISLISELLEDTIYTKPSYVAIRSVFDNEKKNHQWKKMDAFSDEEIERIENRFKNEILSKMKSDSCFCNLIGIDTKN